MSETRERSVAEILGCTLAEFKAALEAWAKCGVWNACRRHIFGDGA